MTEHSLTEARHEHSDVGARAMAYGFAGLLLVLLLIAASLFWMFPGVVADHTINPPLPVYPAPRLQTDTAADMRNFEAREQTELNSLAWRDRAAGTVHLPIADAMREVVARGIADWPRQAPP